MAWSTEKSTRRAAKVLAAQPQRVSSATLVLVNEHGEALIVKAHYKPHWTFPGGVVDPGETPRQAACRETLEEVGITVDSDAISFVSVADRRSAHAETYQFVFRADEPLDAGVEITLQENEIADYTYVSKEQVLTGDRYYGKVIINWAQGVTGYIEQTFGDASPH